MLRTLILTAFGTCCLFPLDGVLAQGATWTIVTPAGGNLDIESDEADPIACSGTYTNRGTVPTLELWRDTNPQNGNWVAESGAHSTGILDWEDYAWMENCGEWETTINNRAEEWTESPEPMHMMWIADHALELATLNTEYDWNQYYTVHE